MVNRELTLQTEDYSLLTDLYELTMVACYAGEDLAERPASFELFVRSLPDDFGYLIAMGLAEVLNYLENWRFTDSQLESLQQLDIFAHAPAQFWSLLHSGRFTGNVWAVPEGTAIFANEPILRVEAPLWQAQVVETFVLNAINYQSLIATKAARIRDAAGPEATLLEFGTRRAFSPQGAVWAARAALAAGLNATSNVIAALKLGQSPKGTMAHSLVMGIGALSGSEDEAFEAFLRYFPDATLLIDTYDTIAAAERIAERIKAGKKVTGVRLDSGDLVELSQKVRSLLPEINIVASGDLDEGEINRLIKAGASIDGYGLGTKLVTGHPVNGVYKLVEIDGIPTMKESSSKVTYPGRKQVFRSQSDAHIHQDRLALADESPQQGEQGVLQLVMKQGDRQQLPETLETIRQRTTATVKRLPSHTRQFTEPTPLTVEISAPLDSLRRSVSSKQ
ncbi:MAG: nicotinate phosphoribosyltransferase [Cyanophyceae cyanobacterium]